MRRSARQILKGRLLDPNAPKRGRWLESDIKDYLAATWKRVDDLLPEADLDALPSIGNRQMVFLALVTTASYRALLDRGVARDYARLLCADMGWKIYSWMLQTASLPFLLITRDSGRRIEYVLRTLMIFPFNAQGKPGYEVSAWSEGNDTYTYWTHCPPQTFVRRLVECQGDHGELEAFYNSWCQYDWPGADLIARDGHRGHYTRTQTLSQGDPVCDMCWRGCVPPGDNDLGK